MQLVVATSGLFGHQLAELLPSLELKVVEIEKITGSFGTSVT